MVKVLDKAKEFYAKNDKKIIKGAQIALGVGLGLYVGNKFMKFGMDKKLIEEMGDDLEITIEEVVDDVTKLDFDKAEFLGIYQPGDSQGSWCVQVGNFLRGEDGTIKYGVDINELKGLIIKELTSDDCKIEIL